MNNSITEITSRQMEMTLNNSLYCDCDSCTKKSVCKYSEGFRKLIDDTKIQLILEKYSNKLPFKLTIRCNEYSSIALTRSSTTMPFINCSPAETAKSAMCAIPKYGEEINK